MERKSVLVRLSNKP